MNWLKHAAPLLPAPQSCVLSLLNLVPRCSTRFDLIWQQIRIWLNIAVAMVFYLEYDDPRYRFLRPGERIQRLQSETQDYRQILSAGLILMFFPKVRH